MSASTSNEKARRCAFSVAIYAVLAALPLRGPLVTKLSGPRAIRCIGVGSRYARFRLGWAGTARPINSS